jgi:hypothetical protein
MRTKNQSFWTFLDPWAPGNTAGNHSLNSAPSVHIQPHTGRVPAIIPSTVAGHHPQSPGSPATSGALLESVMGEMLSLQLIQC